MSSSSNWQQKSSSRPTTPHRLINRPSIGLLSPKQHYAIDGNLPLHDEQFSELADSFAILDDNLIKVNIINESIVKFNESFSSLLYGLLTNSYCTEFSEAPSSENFSGTYLDLDSQIRLARKELSDLMDEEATPKETYPKSNNQSPLAGYKPNSFKKPLTNATLSRLTNLKHPSYLPRLKTKGSVKSMSDGDVTSTTNDSFVENPVPASNLKRKNQFSTGGRDISESRIPIRKNTAAAPKPAWK